MNGVLSRELLELSIIDREFILIKRARVRDLEGKSHGWYGSIILTNQARRTIVTEAIAKPVGARP
jgi:hypothetical protein